MRRAHGRKAAVRRAACPACWTRGVRGGGRDEEVWLRGLLGNDDGDDESCWSTIN